MRAMTRIMQPASVAWDVLWSERAYFRDLGSARLRELRAATVRLRH